MSAGKPNIWYVAHYAGGPGIGRHSRGWYLSHTWQQNGARATVIAANRHHLHDHQQAAGARQVEGVSYHFLPTPSYRTNGAMRVINMFAFAAAFRVAQRELIRLYGKPDVVIASSPHPFSFLATHRLARSLGACSVFEVRDLWPASIVEILNVSPRHPMVRLTAAVERFAYANADAVVSLLPQTEDYMRSRGLTGTRWHYIPNGIIRDEKSERPQQSPIFDQLDTWHKQGMSVVCYTGALGSPNNLECLIGAMAILKRQNAQVRALIVGRGDMEDALRAQCGSLGLGDQVRFFSQVPKAVARAIQENCDIGFIALKSSPMFRFGISPNKIFDYMMSSLPVIAAIDAGNDIVSDAGCGISISSGDPHDVAAGISRLAALPDPERRKLGSNGRRFVEANHDYRLLAEQYMDIFLFQ